MCDLELFSKIRSQIMSEPIIAEVLSFMVFTYTIYQLYSCYMYVSNSMHWSIVQNVKGTKLAILFEQ